MLTEFKGKMKFSLLALCYHSNMNSFTEKFDIKCSQYLEIQLCQPVKDVPNRLFLTACSTREGLEYLLTISHNN